MSGAMQMDARSVLERFVEAINEHDRLPRRVSSSATTYGETASGSMEAI